MFFFCLFFFKLISGFFLLRFNEFHSLVPNIFHAFFQTSQSFAGLSRLEVKDKR